MLAAGIYNVLLEKIFVGNVAIIFPGLMRVLLIARFVFFCYCCFNSIYFFHVKELDKNRTIYGAVVP